MMPRSYVFAVAVENYQDGKITPVKYAENDARKFVGAAFSDHSHITVHDIQRGGLHASSIALADILRQVRGWLQVWGMGRGSAAAGKNQPKSIQTGA
jgi:hypothetical protein